ncbi:hypothetical protein GGR51DRAFT_378842 [Nemania sp. FL0031]|nr:hypothetical protein GGR51DRAFT_378842 [Nemania sp. FL0031]
MESLAALGLASNVIQFISFASKLISTSLEIHESLSGCTDDVSILDTVYGRLNKLSAGLRTRSEKGLFDSLEPHENVEAIIDLSRACEADCRKLMTIVKNIKLGAGLKGPKLWLSFKAAVKAAIEKNEIIRLEERLSRTQVALTLHICTITSDWQGKIAANLKQLQTESRTLGIQRSEEFTRIIESLARLEERVSATSSNPSSSSFSSTEVELLHEQMSQLSVSKHDITKEQTILRSLNFERRTVRHSSIAKAHEETFQWIFEDVQDDGTNFAHWLESGSGIFWVSGKPGSGKSTLMKYIIGEERTAAMLSRWSKPRQIITMNHFFWSPGTEMQKSQQGLLQSLIYDIFRQCPDLIKYVCVKRWSSEPGGEDRNAPWSCSELDEALRSVANVRQIPVKFCIFIDGLDEYNGSHFELCETIHSLAKSSHIKLCVSSRPWNVFEQAFGATAVKLSVHELTWNDIEKFSKDRLQGHPRWPFVTSNPLEGQWLIEEITKRARGVFLWVFLVTKQLREGMTNRDSFSDLRRRLESFPVELDAFFKLILESVEDFYHDKMATSLEITMAATTPLDFHFYEFHDMDYEDNGYVVKLPLSPFSPEQSIRIQDQVVWRLNSRCRGLLEVDANNCINFLHRTVKDFLRTSGMSDFLRVKSPLWFDSRLCLLKAHIAVIKRSVEITQPDLFGEELGEKLRETFRIAEQLEIEPNGRSTEAYDALEELERCMSTTGVQSTLFCNVDDTEGLPSAFQQIMLEFQLVGYLQRNLIKQSWYLPVFGSTTICSVLGRSDLIRGVVGTWTDQLNVMSEPWRERGLEMLRHLLRSHPEIEVNKPYKGGHSAWTGLISYITLWHVSLDNVVEERLWSVLESGVLSLLLELGANPNAHQPAHRDAYRPGLNVTVFQTYLALSFDIDPDPTHEELYLQGLDEFLQAGADVEFVLSSDNASRSVLHKLWRVSTHLSWKCRTAFLGKVIERLLRHAYVFKVVQPRETIGEIAGRWIREAKAEYSNLSYPKRPGYKRLNMAPVTDLTQEDTDSEGESHCVKRKASVVIDLTGGDSDTDKSVLCFKRRKS